MDYIIGILAFIVGFGILVFVHELGHFLMARMNGVRVDEFSIGFPPVVFSKKIGETEYKIGAIPFGGYVKMAGVIDENLDKNITGAEDEFVSKNAFQKASILLGGVLFNYITAFLIFFYFGTKYGENKILYKDVQTIPHHSPFKKYIPEENISLISIAGQEVQSVSEFFDIYLQNMGETLPIEYQLENGSRVKKLIPENMKVNKFLMFDELSAVRGKVFLNSVAENSPASRAGLFAGDTILTMQNEKIASINGLKGILHTHPNDSISITYKRGNETKSTKAFVISDTDGFVKLGVYPWTTTIDSNWIVNHRHHLELSTSEAFIDAFGKTKDQFVMLVKQFSLIFNGTISPKESLGGPIAIAKIFKDSASHSIDRFLRTIAIFSLILAFFNVLPIPALDGGHLLIVIIEGIRRKELSLETKIRIQKIGFTIVVMLMIFTFWLDLSRIF
jgi:regulator of sigma E protease